MEEQIFMTQRTIMHNPFSVRGIRPPHSQWSQGLIRESFNVLLCHTDCGRDGIAKEIVDKCGQEIYAK